MKSTMQKIMLLSLITAVSSIELTASQNRTALSTVKTNVNQCQLGVFDDTMIDVIKAAFVIKGLPEFTKTLQPLVLKMTGVNVLNIKDKAELDTFCDGLRVLRAGAGRVLIGADGHSQMTEADCDAIGRSLEIIQNPIFEQIFEGGLVLHAWFRINYKIDVTKCHEVKVFVQNLKDLCHLAGLMRKENPQWREDMHSLISVLAGQGFEDPGLQKMMSVHLRSAETHREALADQNARLVANKERAKKTIEELKSKLLQEGDRAGKWENRAHELFKKLEHLDQKNVRTEEEQAKKDREIEVLNADVTDLLNKLRTETLRVDDLRRERFASQLQAGQAQRPISPAAVSAGVSTPTQSSLAIVERSSQPSSSVSLEANPINKLSNEELRARRLKVFEPRQKSPMEKSPMSTSSPSIKSSQTLSSSSLATVASGSHAELDARSRTTTSPFVEDMEESVRLELPKPRSAQASAGTSSRTSPEVLDVESGASSPIISSSLSTRSASPDQQAASAVRSQNATPVAFVGPKDVKTVFDFKTIFRDKSLEDVKEAFERREYVLDMSEYGLRKWSTFTAESNSYSSTTAEDKAKIRAALEICKKQQAQ